MVQVYLSKSRWRTHSFTHWSTKRWLTNRFPASEPPLPMAILWSTQPPLKSQWDAWSSPVSIILIPNIPISKPVLWHNSFATVIKRGLPSIWHKKQPTTIQPPPPIRITHYNFHYEKPRYLNPIWSERKIIEIPIDDSSLSSVVDLG